MADSHCFFKFSLFLLMVFTVESSTIYEERLRTDLFQEYDWQTRPSNNTKVTFKLSIKHFEMREQTQSLMVDSWIASEWKDRRVRWHAEDYGGVRKITVPHSMIWTPDLGVYNGASVDEHITYGNTQAIIFSTGRILFIPPTKLHFTCLMDFTYWPHDIHNCTLKLGSWIHDGYQLELVLKDNKPEIDMPFQILANGQNRTRGPWTLLDTNITRDVQRYKGFPEPYITLEMSMLVSRNAPAYEWTIKGPAVGLSILTLVLFYLPPDAGEKMLFGLMCLLLDFLFIAFTSFSISMAPNHTPLLVEMICKQSMLVIGSIVIGAFSLRFSRDPHTTGLPPVIKRPLILLSTWFCITNYRNLAMRSHQRSFLPTQKPNDIEMKENCNGQVYHQEIHYSPGFDWLLLAAFLDRACLIIYFLIFVVNMYSLVQL